MKTTSLAITLSLLLGCQMTYAFDSYEASLEYAVAAQLPNVEYAEQHHNYAVGAKYFLMNNLTCVIPDATYAKVDGVDGGSTFSQICAYVNYRWFLLANKKIPERHLLRFDREDVKDWIMKQYDETNSSKKVWVVVE